MKKVVFYIQIGTKDEIGFGNPFKGISSSDLFIYDMDNHSDQVTLRYTEMLLQEVEEVLLVIHEHSEAGLGQLVSFFEKVVRSKKALEAYSLGKTTLPVGLKKKLALEETTLGELGEIFSASGK